MKKYSLIGPEIKELMQDEDFDQKIRDSFLDLHAYEVSSSLEGLEAADIARILLALGIPAGVDVFEEFEDEDQQEIFKCFSLRQQVLFVQQMSHDERIDLLKTLPDVTRQEIFHLLPKKDREDIRSLMGYEEGSVGALVTTEFATLKQDLTMEKALAYLRQVAPGKETIYYIYVVSEDNRLLGLVSLRELIMAPESKLVKEIMKTEVISIDVHADQEDVVRLIRDYDLLAVPAIDAEGRLVGIVTVDDAVDVGVEEQTEDILNLGAAGAHVDYLNSTPLHAASKRVGWLFILICVGFVSGAVLERYQPVFDVVMPLIFFIPMLCASAGNAGTQSSTVVIRELAMGSIQLSDVGRVLLKEFSIGLLVGGGLGLMAAMRAGLFGGWQAMDWRMGIVVGLSMGLVIVLATSLGAILPILFKRMNLDPALMSGPLIASIVDVCCILTYMEVARWAYGIVV